MVETRSVLGPFQERFLEEYWQKKPLLVRGAFPGGLDAIDPDSLAGLSFEEGIDSRIVVEKGAHPWQTFHGPFDEKFLRKLPKTHWTLLVQAVDRHVAAVSALRPFFSFIPNWRLDDIMISYAVDQGSVGPHTDNYDVFLIQGLGRRRWEYGARKIDEPVFVEGLDMKILETFQAEENAILEPGDMLYLPPGFAHHGTALGECLTYSIGFRAPTQIELLASFAQFLQAAEVKERFYTDSELRSERDPGLIHDAELERLRRMMKEAIEDERVYRRWIGAFLTEPRNFHEPSEGKLQAKDWAAFLDGEEALEKVEGGRFAYHTTETEIFLAVEGETLVVAPGLLPLVKLLCEAEIYPIAQLEAFQGAPGYDELMSHLWNQGFLRLPYEDVDEE